MHEPSVEPTTVIRDSRTIEFRNYIDIPETGMQSGYTIDHYFFLPRNLGIDRSTWTSTDFYRVSQLLLRLKAVDTSLEKLADLNSIGNPGAVLVERAKRLLEPIPVNSESLTAIAQLYGAEVTDSLKHEIADHWGKMKPGAVEPAVERLVNRTEQVLDTLRVVRRQMLCYAPIAHSALLPSLEFAEEYAYAIIDERFAKLAGEIRRAKKLRGEGEAFRAELRLLHAVEEINERRRRNGFARPGGKSQEYYSYRISLLKKELQKSLYVDTRGTGKDPFVSNSAAMVAAGLAATWATIAQVPLIAGRWTTWEGVALFAGAIGAYVLKDRIKDVVKRRLLARWQPWDHENTIVDNIFQHVGLGEVKGRSFERVRWIDQSKVPSEVYGMRQTKRTVRGSSAELDEVLLYTRRLVVDGTDLPTQSSQFGIQAIFRFSLNDILVRLDDPVEQHWFFDENRGQFVHGDIPKVYHLNVVHIAKEDDTGRSWLARSRIVVNRNGILRIETIGADEED